MFLCLANDVSTYTECFTVDKTLFKKGLEKPTAYTGQDITRLCENPKYLSI
jgi:hypothetical protein